MSEDRVAQVEAIATVVEDDKYNYHHAPRELRNIARAGALPPLPAPLFSRKLMEAFV